MALRTFRSNPALGGFGSESTVLWLRKGDKDVRVNRAEDGDAFAQILKELVDNAVDACCASTDEKVGSAKRVRVTIEPYETCGYTNEEGIPSSTSNDAKSKDNSYDLQDKNSLLKNKSSKSQDDDDDDDEGDNEILKVTVTDNGCGMQSIEACVNAFHTSKAHSMELERKTEENIDDSGPKSKKHMNTAGRYGIGLTLCLLHAQRLVPGTCSSIQSATAKDSEWTNALCVVDADNDSIRFLQQHKSPKKRQEESGTAVSVLVPGGVTARVAWPRVAEYFARFKLSVGLTCSLEVLAPTLSKLPLLIRPTTETFKLMESSVVSDSDQHSSDEEKSVFRCTFDDEEEIPVKGPETDVSMKKEKQPERPDSGERFAVWKAVQLYLGQPVEFKNVAHALVPIRFEKVDARNGPKLEVDIVVHDDLGVDCISDSRINEQNDFETSKKEECNDRDEEDSGKLLLIRMVNRIPLLDCAEAVACGLVQALVRLKRMWRSFGLEVSSQTDSVHQMKLPLFHVRDSDQVAPFFQKRVHAAFDDFETLDDDDDNHDFSDSESEGHGDTDIARRKRKREPRRHSLLPAKVRLSNVLVIVQIHANPTLLPLPTLSKGRLPMDNPAIDSALECGLIKCLRELQQTNPSLLLSSIELNAVERDARYVPAVACALTSIICRSKNIRPKYEEKILKWKGAPAENTSQDSDVDSIDIKYRYEKTSPDEMVKAIESRMRSILLPKQKEKKSKRVVLTETSSARSVSSETDKFFHGIQTSDPEDDSDSSDSIPALNSGVPNKTEVDDDFDDWF